MAETILTAIGDAAALAAALCAFLALGKANETIREARAARLDAEQAARDSAAERREAERDRDRHRIEKVGEIIEAVASAAADPRGRMTVHKNRLRQALIGLYQRLPGCAAIVNEVKTGEQLPNYIGKARTEIELELQRLSRESPHHAQ